MASPVSQAPVDSGEETEIDDDVESSSAEEANADEQAHDAPHRANRLEKAKRFLREANRQAKMDGEGTGGWVDYDYGVSQHSELPGMMIVSDQGDAMIPVRALYTTITYTCARPLKY